MMNLNLNVINDDFLKLSLSTPCTLLTLPSQLLIRTPTTTKRLSSLPRRAGNQVLRKGRSEIIPPPYPWATTKRATIHNLQYLRSKGIATITGEVRCKRCGEKDKIHYDLHQKLADLCRFMAKHRQEMRHRAPEVWTNPVLPKCRKCFQSNSLKPVVVKKKSINWLFMLLGQTLGCCKLSELKYFCKHTRNHRTGAKDRVLYLTYMELCRQLHEGLRKF